MKTTAVFLFSILLSLSVSAQVPKWDLGECMKYAVENSPEMVIQQAQNDIYKQNYNEAIGRMLPSVGMRTSVDVNFGRGLNDETNTYTDINSFSNNYGITASVLLFDGLAGINMMKMERVNRLMGREQLQMKRDKLAYATMEAFLNVQYYTEMVALAAQQLEESSQNVRQIERMAELGMKGVPDVVEIEAKQAADNYNLTKQKNTLNIGIIILKEKMNFPIDTELEIEPYRSDDFIARSDISAFYLFERAISFLPEALAAQYSVDAYELSYRAAKGSIYPTLSLEAGISTNFAKLMDGSHYLPFNDQIRNKRGQYVGMTLSIPIFSGFLRSANMKRSRLQLKMAKGERDQNMRMLYSEIEQAVADMNGQADEYAQAKKQTTAMSVAHDVNQRKYREGLVSALDLTTTSNRLTLAQNEEMRALLKFYLKQKLVNYYSGEQLIEE